MENHKLSYAQTEIIQVQEYYKDASINNLAGLLYIKDKVTISKIEQALNYLIKIHASYRIKIKEEKSEYKQYISNHKDKKFDFIDFNNDPEAYHHWINVEIKRNIFDNDSDLYKFTILRLPEGNMAVLTLQHHIISDGWSLTIVGNVLSEYLINENKQETLAYTYLDYVKEELKYTNSKRYERDKQFWLKKLENFESNQLFKKHSTHCAQGDRKGYSLSDIDTHKIKVFCDKNKISINNLFTTAMIILKYKKTYAEKISIGSIMHNRTKQIEKSITGVFSKALPLIVDVSSNNSISELLSKTKIESFNLLKHRKYPYSQIEDDNKNKYGMLDCTISFQNKQYNSKVIENGYSDVWLDNGLCDTPLAISISNRNRNSVLDIDYDYQIAIVNEKEVKYLHKAIVKLVKDIIEHPNKEIKDINLITDTKK